MRNEERQAYQLGEDRCEQSKFKARDLALNCCVTASECKFSNLEHNDLFNLVIQQQQQQQSKQMQDFQTTMLTMMATLAKK
jgi:hypothetical protein